MKPLFASAIVSLALASSVSMACPKENENLLVHEYHGQESMPIAYINTLNSRVVSRSEDFNLAEASLNDQIVCSVNSASKCDVNAQPLKKGPLLDDDKVELVYESSLLAPEKKTLRFVSTSAVEDSGSLCRPIFGR